MQAPHTNAAGRPVLYAGRFALEVKRAGTPEGWTVLDDWEVLPANLVAVEGASELVVLDPLSFPFENLTGALRDVPLIVVLPEGRDADFLAAVFGGPVFERMDFFDRVATADAAVWEDLRRRYRLAGGQLVRLGGTEPGKAAEEIAALLRGEVEEEEGADPAADGTRPGVRRTRSGAYPAKAAHRAQRAVLEPQFAAAHGERAEDVPFRVLEVGAGEGRRAGSFDPARAEYHGLDEDEGAVLAARAEWPEAAFGHLGPDLLFPHKDETFDLVFAVGLLGRHPDPEKRRLFSEMRRVTRPGGRLLFLEDFVTTEENTKSGSRREHSLSVLAFVELLLVATDWQVVMEHVESLRYPDEALTRGGLIAVSRLGVPRRW
jgi:SAM-dependent methyltransferase